DTTPKDNDSRRPKLSLRASPAVSMSPSRVVLTAEFNGGANDFEEDYCPTISGGWGDRTEAETPFDLPPYEAGKSESDAAVTGQSEIKRRFTVEHVFRAGAFHITFRLKKKDKTLTSSSINIQVQPGLRDIS